jgi:hypothetical protein
MCKYLLGLIGFAALGGSPLLAQNPTSVEPITHREIVVGCDGGNCARTVCVPECYTKTTKTTVYSSGCEPFCLCYPSGLGLFGRNCEGGNCKEPKTRRYLMKKVVTCEESATKCVPSQGGCSTSVIQGHAVVAPATIPVNQGQVGVVIVPAVATEPAPFVGVKMPQATGTAK